MPNFKNGRLSEDIKREISGLIREEIKDPRVSGKLVSVVRTELSGDNSYCKVYISCIEGENAAKDAVKGLESASGTHFQRYAPEKMSRTEIHCRQFYRTFG